MIKIIVGITGPSCSGKTTLCNYIEDYGYKQIIHASSIVKERYRLKETELSILEFAKKELNTLGSQTFANDFLKYAEYLNSDEPIIIEGLRSEDELLIFKENYNEVYCIGIYADSKIRFERNKKREGREPIKNFKDFILKDMVEYSFGVPILMSEYCEILIINENRIEEFHSCIESEVINQMLNH